MIDVKPNKLNLIEIAITLVYAGSKLFQEINHYLYSISLKK
jgi:hypothetical protein